MKMIGLSTQEATELLKKHGSNKLEEKRRTTPLDIFTRQFNNFIVYILAAGAAISLTIGESTNFWAITGIISFVILLGFIQEYRAEKAMKALAKIVQPKSKAYRDGKLVEIPSSELVPGDVVELETGDKVPADAKALEITGLKVNESMLTGESEPVEKRENAEIYAGTQVVYGHCKALITNTGMSTKLGQIASLIQTIDEETPLQKRINQLSKHLALLALAACTLTFALGVAKGAPPVEILIIALALAVAAVPEGLPLTLTLTLAYGMKRMAEHNAIIRKMLAVETLGSVTVIATDKTGTLTKNEMTVEKIYTNGKIYTVTGAGYAPTGGIFSNDKKTDADEIALLLQASALCNNASLSQVEGKWSVLGDPTEGALLAASAKAGYWKDDLQERYPRTKEIVFTSERKLMTTIHKRGNSLISFSKGAPETVLEKCNYFQQNGKKEKLDKAKLNDIAKHNAEFSQAGYRTLAIAYSEDKNLRDEMELTFLGLIAMRDPPREEVSQAIATCKQAGITVVMITGDNEETAKAIARSIGLMDKTYIETFKALRNDKLKRIVQDGVITGSELNTLTDDEFAQVVEGISVYGRAMPEQKLRILDAFKARGHIVAMTGDGVNDAPALRKADIGIAMGLKGTDVAKEASAMVLLDDNFSTIVEAVKQGRTIYSNIEKFTTYLISRNFTEVLLILLGIVFLGFQYLPLIALQILFINTFDEVIPALSLGLDPSREEVMKRKPRRPNEQILKKRNLALILATAAFIASAAFTVFMASNPAEDLEKARTLTFATIISTILFIPFAFRSLEEPLTKMGFTSNKLMLVGTASTFAVTVAAMYVPLFQKIFHLTPLTPVEWLLPLAAGIAAMLFIELAKALTKNLNAN